MTIIIFNANNRLEMDPQLKETIEGEILDAIVIGLKQNQIKEAELPIIASFVITNIDAIKTRPQLIGFLNSLASKWHIFANLASIEEGKVKRFIEIKTANQALHYLTTGRINEATNLVKQVI